jgi:hypothetical protein
MTRRVENAKIDIALQLDTLHEEMMVLASAMQFIAGFEPSYGDKADELIAMAAKAKDWANAIEEGQPL